jgi:hypothetical protein
VYRRSDGRRGGGTERAKDYTFLCGQGNEDHQLGAGFFLSVATDDFEMPVSCARRFNDFCGICSNIAPVSSNFLR